MELDTTRPFTRSQARLAGITDAQLRGRRFRRLFRGVHIDAHVDVTPALWMHAALVAGPSDAVISHLTALWLYGLELRRLLPLHVSTRTRTHTRQAGIQAHQRSAPISARSVGGVAVTSPLRTLVDIATKVTTIELVQAAEHLIHRRLTTSEEIAEYAMARHLDGVRRLRRVLGLIREGVESPRESTLRLMIVFARLPEPRCNVDIHDGGGRFIARGDLVYETYRLVVEYDGWYHERSAAQRQRDLGRRERLEAAGWRVIVVTSDDMRKPEMLIARIHQALVARGYDGPRPVLSIVWSRWFPSAHTQDVGTYVPESAA
jgi:very-short-patch-repair endonuclease